MGYILRVPHEVGPNELRSFQFSKSKPIKDLCRQDNVSHKLILQFRQQPILYNIRMNVCLLLTPKTTLGNFEALSYCLTFVANLYQLTTVKRICEVKARLTLMYRAS